MLLLPAASRSQHRTVQNQAVCTSSTPRSCPRCVVATRLQKTTLGAIPCHSHFYSALHHLHLLGVVSPAAAEARRATKPHTSREVGTGWPRWPRRPFPTLLIPWLCDFTAPQAAGLRTNTKPPQAPNRFCKLPALHPRPQVYSVILVY